MSNLPNVVNLGSSHTLIQVSVKIRNKLKAIFHFIKYNDNILLVIYNCDNSFFKTLFEIKVVQMTSFKSSGIQSQVESYQRWYLMLPCLTLSIIRYGSSSS